MPFIVIPDGNVAFLEPVALIGLLPPVAGGGRGLPVPREDARGPVPAGSSGEPDAAGGAGGTVPGPIAGSPASVFGAAKLVAGQGREDGAGRAEAPVQQPSPFQHGDASLPGRSFPSVASSRTRSMLGRASATLRLWTAGLPGTAHPVPGSTRAPTPPTCLDLAGESAVWPPDGDGMLYAIAAAAANEIMAASRSEKPSGGRSTAADPDASGRSSAEDALLEGGADGEAHPAR